MKEKPAKCFFCHCDISIKQNLYYLFVHMFTDTKKQTKHVKYLHVCQKCFQSNADDKLKEVLTVPNPKREWKICPYCNIICAYTSFRMQIAQIEKSEMQSTLIHPKCYKENIGIDYERFI